MGFIGGVTLQLRCRFSFDKEGLPFYTFCFTTDSLKRVRRTSTPALTALRYWEAACLLKSRRDEERSLFKW